MEKSKYFAIIGKVLLFAIVFLVLLLFYFFIQNKQNGVIISENKKSISDQIIKIDSAFNETLFGIKRKVSEPTSKWIRIAGSEGKVANAKFENTDSVVNDFDKLSPWRDIYSYNYSPSNNEIGAKIGEPGYKTNEIGTDVLTYIPEFWYKRERLNEFDGLYEYIYISAIDPNDSSFTKSESFSIGRYESFIKNKKIYSVSGQFPAVNRNQDEFREIINNTTRNTEGRYCMQDYRYFILQLLYLVEYADYNSQMILGDGWTSSNEPVITGKTDPLLMNSGCYDGAVVYRGVENIFGNIWKWIDGIVIDDYTVFVCTDPEQYANKQYYASDSFDRIKYTISEYTQRYTQELGYDEKDNNSSFEGIKSIIALPTKPSKTILDYVSDYYWTNKGENGLLQGGFWIHINAVGLFCYATDIPLTEKDSSIGCRIIKYM